MKRQSVRLRALAVRPEGARNVADAVAAEEPLEIRVAHGSAPERSLTVTMRTPGNDFELAVGFLLGEGVLRSFEDLEAVRYCVGGPSEQEYNVVTVALRRGAVFDPERFVRHVTTTAACGVCGTASLEALELFPAPSLSAEPVVDGDVMAGMPDALREMQHVFATTGGLHAAGLFEPGGSLILAREDVGRHNAVDKLSGRLFLDRKLPAHGAVLVVSGRVSFEIMQKAYAAGIAFVAAVGAPTSLAVDVANRFGMTLAGFVRDGGFNVYAGPSRIRLAASRSDGVSTSSSASADAT